MGENRMGNPLDRVTADLGGLEIADVIRSYLERAGGDPRLALAFSVTDGAAAVRRAAALARSPSARTDRAA